MKFLEKKKTKDWIKKTYFWIEAKLPYFVTLRTRPKRAAQFGLVADTLVSKSAIVIQGPILKTEDFTLETVKMYVQMFTGTRIIVSTWATEDAEYLKKIEALGAIVIPNPKPAVAGTQNMNMQIVSTRAGINKARELGAEFVLKTRTDQRVYNPNSLSFLYNTLLRFPVATNFKQKFRIVGASLNSFKYRTYGLSDMLLFGHIDDMETYWNAPLDDNGSVYANLKLKINEVYLATTFLSAVGRPVLWTLADSWAAFRDNFCVVDEQSLDMYWYKYSRMKEYRYRHYDALYNDQEMSFVEWFNIYSALENKKPVDAQKIISIIP